MFYPLSLSLSGSIFHVRVHTLQKGLEHALLYSIGVNLPAHRVGQLDRILVLASPINDINIHAWDLNRVKRFMRLDVGVQMELCPFCMITHTQSTSITFILDKVFHDECIDFLCKEAHVSNQPVQDGGLMVYPVNHICSRPSRSLHDPLPPPPPPYLHTLEGSRVGNHYHIEDGPPELPPRKYVHTPDSNVCGYTNVSKSDSCVTSIYGAQATNTATCTTPAASSNADDLEEFIPPRNITRRNFESAIPAIATPYTNFQPHLFQQSSSSFESPYQISSRIIITNSGEVQYESNVLGNKSKPRFHGGFHFKQDIPLPPRSSTAHKSPQPNKRPSSSPTMPKRPYDPQLAHLRSELRASELLESDDAYVFIPDVIRDPSRRPLLSPPSSTFDSQVNPSGRPEPFDSYSSPLSTTLEAQTSSTLEAHLPPMPSVTHESHSHISSQSTTSPESPIAPSHNHPTLSSHIPQTPTLKPPSPTIEPEALPPVECQSLYVSSSLEPPPHKCHTTHSLPRLTGNEYHLSEQMTTRSLSLDDCDDYDDVVIVSQQVHIGGQAPQLNGHLNSPEVNARPPPPPILPRRTHSHKPAVKPRMKLPDPDHTSWSDVNNSSCKRSAVKRALTIPRNPTSNIGLQSSTSHYVLNSYSTDDACSPTMERRTLHHSSDNILSSVHKTTNTLLTYSPLTPPVPKPRVRFMDHLPVQYTKDNSQVEKSSLLPGNTRTLVSPPLEDWPVSDV